MPVGSSRSQRLDPLALPVRFTANDAGADERMRDVELTRERVVLRRAVRGIRMAVNLPVTAFLGIALWLNAGNEDAPGFAIVSLEHRDARCRCRCLAQWIGATFVAEWRLWGRVLGLPLLVRDVDGQLREPFTRMGGVRLGRPSPRRRRKNAVRNRRPKILLRRRSGCLPAVPTVHAGEREIIARN
jgi:hypothetical protein